MSSEPKKLTNEEIADNILGDIDTSPDGSFNAYRIGYLIKQALDQKDAELKAALKEKEAELSVCRELSDLRLEGESKYRKESYRLKEELNQIRGRGFVLSPEGQNELKEKDLALAVAVKALKSVLEFSKSNQGYEKLKEMLIGINEALSNPLLSTTRRRIEAMGKVVEAAKAIWEESEQGQSQVIHYKKLEDLAETLNELEQIK